MRLPRFSLIILICAYVSEYTASYYLQLQAVGGNVCSLTLVALFKGLFMLIPGIVSYYRSLSLATVYHALVLVFFVYSGILALSPFADVPLVLIDIVQGGMSGLMALLAISSFTAFRLDRARRGLLISLAAATALLPAVHLLVDMPQERFREIMLWAYMVATALFFLVQEKPLEPFPSVRDATAEYEGTGRILYALFPTRSVSVITELLALMVFNFFFGVLEPFFYSLDYTYYTADSSMLVIVGIIVLILVLSSMPAIRKQLDAIFFLIVVGSLVVLFVSLAFVSDPAVAFGVMIVGKSVLHVQILLFLIETSIERSLPPFFRYAVIISVFLALPNILGRLLSEPILGASLSWDSFAMSRIAIAALAFVTLVAVVALALVVWLKERRGPSEAGAPAGNADSEERALSALQDEFGLTQRELEVAALYSQGRSVPVISSMQFVSESTVKTHIKSIYAKLGIHSKQELIALIADRR